MKLNWTSLPKAYFMKRVRSWLLVSILLVSAGLVAIAGNYKKWFMNTTQVVEQPDAKTEFRKIGERFLKHDTLLNIKGTIKLFDGEKPTALKEENNFQVIKEPGHIYNRLGYVQTFYSDNRMIQLDTVNQLLVVAATGSPQPGLANALQPSTDVLFSDTAAFTTTGVVTGDSRERTLSLTSELQPEIRVYRVTYDAVTYQIRRAVIEWWKDEVVSNTAPSSQVWITQIDYQYLPESKLQVAELLKKVVTVSQHGIQPAERYKDYQLHIAEPQQP